MGDTLQRKRIALASRCVPIRANRYSLSENTTRGFLFAPEEASPTQPRGMRSKNTMSGETIMRKPKTGVPMVLGVIAFVLSLPSSLCASMCAGVISAASDGAVSVGWFPAVVFGGPLVCMIASFFCKKPSSKGIGIFIILVALFFMVVSVLIGAFLNIVSAILFFIGGALCIANASRPE